MIALQQLTRAAASDQKSLYSQLRNLHIDLEAQLNRQPSVSSKFNLGVPEGIKRNDLVINLVKGVLRVGMFDGENVRYLNAEDLQSLQKHNCNFVGFFEDTTAVAAAATRNNYFPNNGDFGFYRDTGVGFYFFFNYNGTSQFVAM